MTTEGSTSPLQEEEEGEHPVPADKSNDKEDGGGEPSDGEGHDLLHSSRETRSVSPSPTLAKVGRDICTQCNQ